MARWRPVDTRLWNDREFKMLPDDGRLLWLFLLTCPSNMVPGVIVGGPAGLAETLGWSPERFVKRFGELSSKGLRVRADFDARLVWLPNALKYGAPENPNQVKGWSKTWDEVPECSLKHDIWRALKTVCDRWPEQFQEGFPEPLSEPSRNQEQEQDQEKDQNPPIPPLQGGTGIAGRRKRRGKTADPTESEIALSREVLTTLSGYSGVEYEGADEHIRLITNCLRRGRTVLSLRKVAWYCARVLEWVDDPKMSHYLRPETLFGPKNITKYLDAAVSKYRQQFGTDEDVRQREAEEAA